MVPSVVSWHLKIYLCLRQGRINRAPDRSQSFQLPGAACLHAGQGCCAVQAGPKAGPGLLSGGPGESKITCTYTGRGTGKLSFSNGILAALTV